jgi:uncharacterized protein
MRSNRNKMESPSPADLDIVAAQLGRSPRATRAIAHRCPCGNPDVVETSPRLPDGTPFPTLFYLTCPHAVAACSRLESAGVMRDMQERLSTDPELAEQYEKAFEDYLSRRKAIEDVPEIAHVAAGGMPNRVKCLHVQLGHALAVGRGINPFGDEVRDAVEPWWAGGPCVTLPSAAASSPSPSTDNAPSPSRDDAPSPPRDKRGE